MADVPVTEVVQVDAVLDGLSSPTSSQVWDAVEEFSDTAIAVAAARRSLATPSGGSQPTIYTGDGPINPTGTLVELSEETPSTSGTFTLTFGGDTTDPIAFDATTEDIVNALASIPSTVGSVAVAEGYEGYVLSELAIRFRFTGSLQGPTEAPTVTNDLTDNGVAVTLDFTGDPGEPELPALYDIYVVAGVPPLLYVYDGSTWAVTSVANNAITTDKLVDGSVTTAKIAGSAVDSSRLGDGAVLTQRIAERAVTGGKIALATVSAENLNTPVNHLAHGSTVDQLIDALIVGQVMAAS